MAPIDLLALAGPLEPVRLPNGRELAVRPLNKDGWAMLREVQATSDDAKALELIAWILPDATPDDIGSLGIAHVSVLLMYAARKLEAPSVAASAEVVAP